MAERAEETHGAAGGDDEAPWAGEKPRRVRFGAGWREGSPGDAEAGTQIALFAEAERAHDERHSHEVEWWPLSRVPAVDVAPEPGMVDSVRAYGLLFPVIVSADGTRVLDGRRRVAAMRAVWGADADTQVPVQRGGAGELAEVAYTLTANWHRAPNLATEAEAVRRLLFKGYSTERIARTFVVRLARVQALARVAGLPRVLYEALQRGELPPSIAQRASRFPVAVQHVLADVFTERGALTRYDLEAARRAMRGKGEEIEAGDLFEGDTEARVLISVPITWRKPLEALAEFLLERRMKRGDIGISLVTAEDAEALAATLPMVVTETDEEAALLDRLAERMATLVEMLRTVREGERSPDTGDSEGGGI